MRSPGKIMVTGGCGFIGSNFVRHILLTHADAHVVNLDALTYAGSTLNLKDIEGDPRYRFIKGNVCDPHTVGAAMEGAAMGIPSLAISLQLAGTFPYRRWPLPRASSAPSAGRGDLYTINRDCFAASRGRLRRHRLPARQEAARNDG